MVHKNAAAYFEIWKKKYEPKSNEEDSKKI